MAEKKLRAFTWTNPRRWDCPEDDGRREAREIVAARSKTEAAALFAAGVGRVLPSDVREDATAAETALALGTSGAIFWRPAAASCDRYVRRGEAWAEVVWVEGRGFERGTSVLDVHGVRVRFSNQKDTDGRYGERGRWVFVPHVDLGVPDGVHCTNATEDRKAVGRLAEDFAIEVLNLEIERLTLARDTLLRARPPGAKTP